MGTPARVSVVSLQEYFPNLQRTDHDVTSPASPNYNCLAWAAGVADQWWWPDPMGVSTWPPSVARAETIKAFIEAFQTLGYVPGADDTVEPQFDKVALYALAGVPKHAARQLSNGRWTSKLGCLEDIEHTLAGISGSWYGDVVEILKRPKTIP